MQIADADSRRREGEKLKGGERQTDRQRSRSYQEKQRINRSLEHAKRTPQSGKICMGNINVQQ